MKKVLLTTSVPARAQIIKKDDTLYYIDGAHTPMSIRCACTWFNQCLATSVSSCVFSIIKGFPAANALISA